MRLLLSLLDPADLDVKCRAQPRWRRLCVRRPHTNRLRELSLNKGRQSARDARRDPARCRGDGRSSDRAGPRVRTIRGPPSPRARGDRGLASDSDGSRRASSSAVTTAAFIDAHCHLDQCIDPTGTARAAAQAGVVVIAVTETPARYEAVARLFAARSNIRVALGLHPLRAIRATKREVADFVRLLPEVDYVGEVGLDYSREGKPSQAAQVRILDEILAAPGASLKVWSLHSRRADADVIGRLETQPITGILHSSRRTHRPTRAAKASRSAARSSAEPRTRASRSRCDKTSGCSTWSTCSRRASPSTWSMMSATASRRSGS